jgi:hypothetical protein
MRGNVVRFAKPNAVHLAEARCQKITASIDTLAGQATFSGRFVQKLPAGRSPDFKW